MTIQDLGQSLQRALAAHQSGRLAEAETRYRDVLSADPRQPDATHFLGLVAHQCGQQDAAVELMKKSIELQPNNALFYNNLGGVYKQLGKLE